MTDTLHSRILRTIEDWNRQFSHGVMQGDMYALAVRIDRLFQASVTPEFLTTLRADLIKQIELLDRTLTLASNSDAEKERDEFALGFLEYLNEYTDLDIGNYASKERYKELLSKFKEEKG